MKIFFGALTLVLSLPLSVSASPSEQIPTRLQLAQVDYTVIHSRLIEKCKTSSPESIPELTKAIAQWDSSNSPALRQLKIISSEHLAKIRGISQIEATAQSEKISEMMTNGLRAQFDNVSGDELKAACNGGYAATSLQSPMLNFSELLNEVVQVKKAE
jgi:hypothetical protein